MYETSYMYSKTNRNFFKSTINDEDSSSSKQKLWKFVNKKRMNEKF